MGRRHRIVALSLALTGSAIACGTDRPEDRESSEPTTIPSATASVATTTSRPTVVPSTSATTDPSTSATPTLQRSTAPSLVTRTSEAAVIGEVPPDIIDAIIARALAEHAVTPSGVEVTGAEAVVWSDGSLGCPEPGTVYRQAPVAGYRVQLAADGELWDYRVGGQGWIILCDRPTGRDAISTIDP